MSNVPSHVVNLDQVEEVDYRSDDHWGYPDSNKVMVRSQGYVGFLENKPYTEGEPLPVRSSVCTHQLAERLPHRVMN